MSKISPPRLEEAEKYVPKKQLSVERIFELAKAKALISP